MWVQFQLGLHLLKVNCVICCFLKIKKKRNKFKFFTTYLFFVPVIGRQSRAKDRLEGGNISLALMSKSSGLNVLFFPKSKKRNKRTRTVLFITWIWISISKMFLTLRDPTSSATHVLKESRSTWPASYRETTWLLKCKPLSSSQTTDYWN